MLRGEGAFGDAGAGGAAVVFGSPGGDGAPQRVALRSRYAPGPMPRPNERSRRL